MKSRLNLVGALSVCLALGSVDTAEAANRSGAWDSNFGGSQATTSNSYGRFFNGSRFGQRGQRDRNNYNFFNTRPNRGSFNTGRQIPRSVFSGPFFVRPSNGRPSGWPIFVGGGSSSGNSSSSTSSSSGGGSVPAPGTLLLLLSGLIGIVAFRRKI